MLLSINARTGPETSNLTERFFSARDQFKRSIPSWPLYSLSLAQSCQRSSTLASWWRSGAA